MNLRLERTVHESDDGSSALAEAALRSPLLDGMSDSIILHDLEGNIFYANEAACNTRGYERAELLGMNLKDLDAPEYASRISHRIEEVLRGGESRFETVTTAKDGRTFPCEVSARMLDVGGEKLILSVVRDISSRKEMELELAASRRMLEDVTQGIQEGIFLLTSDFEILWANKAAIERSHYPHDSVIGNYCYKVSHGLDSPCAPPSDPCPVQELRETGQPVVLDHRHVDAGGNVSFVEVSAYPTRVEDGKPVEFAHVMRDITQRKQYEEELERLNKELEAFSFSVSHDLRAPLRAIAGFTRIIMDDYSETLAEDVLRLMDIVVKNTDQMSRLVEALLSLSHLDRRELEMSRIDVDALVAEVYTETANAFPDAHFEFKASVLPAATGDMTLVRQVFANLISNAVKFSSKSDGALVIVGGQEEGDSNVYWVKDNGVGFDMAYSDKLFGVFQRLHSEDDFEGEGIGLANVQRIVTRHGGRVWAEGAPGKGAAFFFSLPRTPPPALGSAARVTSTDS
jgi:PAS domain S-box-containing protein